MTDICMGKPIAYIGHMTYCPKCKGSFAIVEGVTTTTFYGNGVALEGMKTACGAILIATQFTDTVDWSTGGAGRAESTIFPPAVLSDSFRKNHEATELDNTLSSDSDEISEEYFYSLLNENGDPVDGYLYDLHLDEKLIAQRAAYDSGDTMVVEGNTESRLVYWLAKDGGARS